MLAVQTLVLAVLLWLAFRVLRRAAGGFSTGGVDGSGGGDKTTLSAGAAAAAAAAAAGRSPREAQLVADTWEFAAESELPPHTTAARVLILYATEYGFSKDVARRVAAALATGTTPTDGEGGAGAAVAAAAAAAFEDDPYDDDEGGAVGSGLSGLRSAVAAAASSRGGGSLPPLVPRVVNMAEWRAVRLGREGVVLVVMSTTGDGVVPSEATELKEALEMDGVGALRLDADASAGGKLPRYSVLALGDRGYPHFCRGGIIMEELLDGAIAAAMREQGEAAAAAAGAAGEPSMNGNGTAAVASTAALTARQDVDQEDWASITDWLSRTVAALSDLHRVGQLPTVVVGGNGDDDAAMDMGNHAAGSVDYLFDAIRAYAAEEGAKNEAGGSTALTHYSRNAPLMAAVVEKTTLTDPTAVVPDVDRKEVVRVVFDTTGSSLAYTAGDALGIVPHNDPATVARVLVALAADGGEEVGPTVGSGGAPASPPVAGGGLGTGVGGGGGGGGGSSSSSGASAVAPTTLREALTSAVDLKTVRAELLAALARAAHAPGQRSRAAALAASPTELATYASDREVLDALADFPSAALTPRELLKALRPLHARYYSVSSSPVTSPTAVAITVDVLRYTLRGVPRQGVASSQLADRVALGDRVGVFITANAHFRLPTDGATPIVMIGPGTGIAPFVGFLEERAARGGNGRNVLFTGCRHEQQDFLYGTKLRAAAAARTLELHAAFSRDGPAKVYVQHLMAAVADDLWELVDRARAHVYVCGDASRMAGDVHAAWLAIVRRGRECDTAAAETYMADLEKAGRYQRDVWAS
ncbi:hypothetical protein MMPV_008680 [Pyropia vietnamensis]